MTTNKFKLASHKIKPIVGSMGGCIATDRITVEGHPVRFMYGSRGPARPQNGASSRNGTSS